MIHLNLGKQNNISTVNVNKHVTTSDDGNLNLKQMLKNEELFLFAQQFKILTKFYCVRCEVILRYYVYVVFSVKCIYTFSLIWRPVFRISFRYANWPMV